MVIHSNKSVAEILIPSILSSSPEDTVEKVHTSSSSSSVRNDNVDDSILERKMSLATEGFTRPKFCELVLKDRNRLSEENALTICDYIIAIKREVNPRLSYKRNTIQFLSELSRAVGIQKKFINMTREEFDTQIELLACKNCMINLKTLESKPHSPDFMAKVQIPVRYEEHTSTISNFSIGSEIMT
jgi:hypothetical protein